MTNLDYWNFPERLRAQRLGEAINTEMRGGADGQLYCGSLAMCIMPKPGCEPDQWIQRGVKFRCPPWQICQEAAHFALLYDRCVTVKPERIAEVIAGMSDRYYARLARVRQVGQDGKPVGSAGSIPPPAELCRAWGLPLYLSDGTPAAIGIVAADCAPAEIAPLVQDCARAYGYLLTKPAVSQQQRPDAILV